MPRGDKSAYTDKQKRKAEHIEEGYEDRGVGHEEAERRAWATVNKESGGRQQVRLRARQAGKPRFLAQGRPERRSGLGEPFGYRSLYSREEGLGDSP